MTSTGRHLLVLLFILVSVFGLAEKVFAIGYFNGQALKDPKLYIGPTGTYKENEDVTIYNDCGDYVGWHTGYYLDKSPPTKDFNNPFNNAVIITSADNAGQMQACGWGGETLNFGKLAVGWHTLHTFFVGYGGGEISFPPILAYVSQSFEVCVANFFDECESARNSCGDYNIGVINCQGKCVDANGRTPVTPEERPRSAWDSSCIDNSSPDLSSGAQCVANAYQSCESASANSCGDTDSGYVDCSGACISLTTGQAVSTPGERSEWNKPCTTPANACGQVDAGTTDCNGACSAGYMPIPETTLTGATYNEFCSRESTPNACGQTAVNDGTIQCNGYCSAGTPSPPDNPDYYNQSCETSANACGQKSRGTLDCSRTCSAGYTPPPEVTLTGALYNSACSLNLCGVQYDGAVGCSGVCDTGLTPSGAAAPAAETPAPPRATITAPTSDQLVLDGTSVTYSGTGTADTSLGANTITGYEWRDGACTTGTLVSTSASFSQVFSTGAHIIYLRVKDSHGTWSTDCPSVMTTESVRQPPISKIHYPPGGVVGSALPTSVPTFYPALPIFVDRRFGDNTIVVWEWRADSCSGPILKSATYPDPNGPAMTYTSPGIYRVYLREKDSYGLWSTNCPSTTIYAGMPAIAGVCGATHYTCTAGSLGYGMDSSTGWNWYCSGMNTDNPFSGNATCHENTVNAAASLSASALSVPYNGRVTLTWSSSNAVSCRAPSGNWSNNGSLSGSLLTNPLTTDTTFTFQCENDPVRPPFQNNITTLSPLQSVTVRVATPPISASYTVAPLSGFVGDVFNWVVSNVRGGMGFGSYAYSWSGGPGSSDSLSGTGKTVAKSYTTTGGKTGTVTVTSGGVSRVFSCPVSVAARPDLTANAPTITLSTDASRKITGAISASIQNIDGGSTNTAFTNLFQRADAYNSSTDSATNVQNIGTSQSSTLAGNTAATTTLSYEFPATDENKTRYIRVCADKNSSGATTITESNENNNCGPWTSVVVYPALTATCSVSATDPPPGLTGYYTTQTFTYSVSATGGSGSYTYSNWVGGPGTSDSLTGTAPSTSKKYTTGGDKTASITVTSAEFSRIAACSINVQPIADLVVTPP